MTGYIKLYRKLLENPIFKNPDLLQLFIYIMLRVSHKSGKAFYGSNEINIDKGQFVTGRFELAKDLHQNESGIYKRLKRLETLHVVALQSNNRNTVVTVVNWDLYQCNNDELDNKVTTEEQQSNNKVTTEEQQSNNKVTQTRMKEGKNEKKVKKVKNIYSEFVSMLPDEYQKLIDEFGNDGTKERIDRLNLYKGSTGKKYASDYLTILNWERKNSPQGKSETPISLLKKMYKEEMANEQNGND